MLDRLKKQLGIVDAVASPELTEIQEQLAQLQSQFEGVQANLSDAVNTITTLSADKANLEAALATAIEHSQKLEADVKEAAEKQLAAKLEARKAKLEATIGSEKVNTVFEATKELEDAAFNAVVTAMATSIEVEAQSELFKEAGVAGDAEPAKEMTAEERILRAKYNVK